MSAPPESGASVATRTVFSGEVELSRDLQLPGRPVAPSGRLYDEAHLLVRIGAEPIGFVDVALGDATLSRERVLAAIDRQLSASLRAELRRQGLPGLDPLKPLETSQRSLLGSGPEAAATSVTVAVCTRDRAQLLSACLEALRGLEHDRIEFIIVDNAPSDESTREAIEVASAADPRFRYAREPAPGLSRARNLALAEASGQIIAFTDDDVRVDPLWIKAILRGFGRRDDVGCVTGMVASASLEHPAEQYFDGRVWWSSKCETGIYDLGSGPTSSALHPYAAGAIGTGANFAVRVEPMRDLGGFDECLGAGSPTAGGEDGDAFVRIIRAGYAISYEPAALVWHVHRMDQSSLQRQMFEYGKGLSAYLYKYISAPRTSVDVLRRLPQGLARLAVLGSRSSRVGHATGFSRELMFAEMRGLLAGPLAYARARRSQDPERRRAVAPR